MDEAVAGFCGRIEVVIFEDGSLEVYDNGRGMPVDIHAEEGLSGVEVILTRLHAGAKFSDKNYRFSGGLHGVGVSVVNALSRRLEVRVRRGGHEHFMAFESGMKVHDLEKTREVGLRTTGTTIRFWPDPIFFDNAAFSVQRLVHSLRAKAVLCSGLTVILKNEKDGSQQTWRYENGLPDYLKEFLNGNTPIPQEPFTGHFTGETEEVSWAVTWLTDGEPPVAESYVNLIPTPQGGTHVNGFRTGLLSSMREFVEYRSLLPRGMKLAPDDVWSRLAFVLSVKMHDPQFSGQTKERLSSRQAARFVSGITEDAFTLYLNQHIQVGEKIAEIIIQNAQARMRLEKNRGPQESDLGTRTPREACRLRHRQSLEGRALSRGRGFRRRLREASPGSRVPGYHAPSRENPQHMGGGRP